ncbi:MAG: hypothetical protein NC413_13340 [Muribaculum sp.]|nr:hypothetical protein [Muribaculum sp.]
MMKTLEMEHIVTDNHTARTHNKSEVKDMYMPILQKIRYWRDYTGTGDIYRMEHDLDCILTDGNLFADTIFSLWLPLRYTLNYYSCELWDNWKDFEAETLRPKGLGLKDCPDFLNALIENIDVFLPPTGLTILLTELFKLGQQRCNVMILPYRSWNSRRGCSPYWDYIPHFLYDLMNTDSPLFLQALHTWLRREHLEMLFNGSLEKNNLKDLAGTGAVWRHAPTEINVERLLHNYIEILKERKLTIEDVA